MANFPSHQCFFLEDCLQSWLRVGDASWMPKVTLMARQPQVCVGRRRGAIQEENTHSTCGSTDEGADSALETFHFTGRDYTNKSVVRFMLKPYSRACRSAIMMETRPVASRGVRYSQLLINEGQLIWSGAPLEGLWGHISVTWTILMSAFRLRGWA